MTVMWSHAQEAFDEDLVRLIRHPMHGEEVVDGGSGGASSRGAGAGMGMGMSMGAVRRRARGVFCLLIPLLAHSSLTFPFLTLLLHTHSIHHER